MGSFEEEAAAAVQVATDGAGKGEGENGEALWIYFEGGGFLSVGCEGVRRVKVESVVGSYLLLLPHSSPGKPVPHALPPQQPPPVAWRSGLAGPRGSGHPSTLNCMLSWA